MAAGEWRDILVVKREEEKEKEKEKEALNRNVSRLRIKVIAFSGFSSLLCMSTNCLQELHTGYT